MCADQAGSGFILLVHWYDWYDWYEWNIIPFHWYSIGELHISYGIHRQIVHARPSGVDICSLQMKHRSAEEISIRTNGVES